MSAQPNDGYPTVNPELQEQVPGSGILGGIHEIAEGRRAEAEREARNAEQRQMLLDSFYDYAKDKNELDARTTDLGKEHDLAISMEGFAFSLVHTRLEKLQAQQPKDSNIATPDIKLLDPIRVNERTNRHYTQFGENRRYRTPAQRREEESFFAESKRRATAIVFDADRRDELNPFVDKPLDRTGVPRHAKYPEIRIIMELREALLQDRALVAAKAAEVVFAVYGSTFPANIRRSPLFVDRDGTGVLHQLIKTSWEEDELPPDELPDKIVPRRKQRVDPED